MDGKQTYRIQYVDNTFQLIEWTDEEYVKVGEAFTSGFDVIVLKTGIFRLDHIRAIVYLEAIEEPEDQEGDPIPDENGMIVTEMGAFEKDVFDLLVQNGIEVGNVIGERRSK